MCLCYGTQQHKIISPKNVVQESGVTALAATPLFLAKLPLSFPTDPFPEKSYVLFCTV